MGDEGTKKRETDLVGVASRLRSEKVNRGLEISSELADRAESLILDQVAAGVAVRMALLHLYLSGPRSQD